MSELSWTLRHLVDVWASCCGLVVESTCHAGATGDMGSIPESERSPRVRNDCPLQYSYQENPMDRGAWQTTVHGTAKSRTQLSKWAYTCPYIWHNLYSQTALVLFYFSSSHLSSNRMHQENGNSLPCSCLGEVHGQRSLAGYIVHGVTKESDTTEPLNNNILGPQLRQYPPGDTTEHLMHQKVLPCLVVTFSLVVI